MKKSEWRIKPKHYQYDFLVSKERYPAIIAGIGTGKSFFLLLKIWNYCQEFPDSLALIVRKEFTDLRDSTIKDFESYFGVKVNSNKEYEMPNGSVVMFRHGEEISKARVGATPNVLKNINLSIFGIEQAEEFQNEDTFTFLRDRLRRQNAPYRQGLLIANANGHNWLWKMWINNPSSDQFKVWQATTWDNADNLPKDFLDDLKAMELDSPNHYQQYVMNSHEEVEGDDFLLTYEDVMKATEIIVPVNGHRRVVLGADIARYGDNETVFGAIESYNGIHWDFNYIEPVKGKETTWSAGRLMELKRTLKVSAPYVIDDDGVGGGVTDILRDGGGQVSAFRGGAKASNEYYENATSEAAFVMAEMIKKGYLKLPKDEVLIDQLLTLRFTYSNKKKKLISKEEMRRKGIASPDRADVLKMLVMNREKAEIRANRRPQNLITGNVY